MILSLLRRIRDLIALVDLAILTVSIIVLSWLPKAMRPWFKQLFVYWCRVFIRAFDATLHIHERFDTALPKQYIVIGNHPSAFEDIGMPSVFPVRYVAKKELRDWFLVGRVAEAIGCVFVDRACKASRNQTKAALLNALENGDSIGVYPEGGCKGRRIHLPFQYGIFDLSLKTGVPIVPVFIHYEMQEQFEWDRQHLLVKIWQMYKAPNKAMHYHIYDPIDPKQFESVAEFTEAVEAFYKQEEKRWLK